MLSTESGTYSGLHVPIILGEKQPLIISYTAPSNMDSLLTGKIENPSLDNYIEKQSQSYGSEGKAYKNILREQKNDKDILETGILSQDFPSQMTLPLKEIAVTL